jgi:hypothetical protein
MHGIAKLRVREPLFLANNWPLSHLQLIEDA